MSQSKPYCRFEPRRAYICELCGPGNHSAHCSNWVIWQISVRSPKLMKHAEIGHPEINVPIRTLPRVFGKTVATLCALFLRWSHSCAIRLTVCIFVATTAQAHAKYINRPNQKGNKTHNVELGSLCWQTHKHTCAHICTLTEGMRHDLQQFRDSHRKILGTRCVCVRECVRVCVCAG